MDRERVRRSGVMAVVASFALVVLAACGSGAGEVAHEEPVTRVPVMSDAAAQATREAASGATPGAGGATGEAAMEVTVTSNDIFFEPTEVTIPANTNVKFILPNVGAAAHDFSIDELGIQVSIAPGATKDVIVNAPAGTYEFYCNVPGHKQAGMVGTLTVTGDAAAAPAAASPAAGAGATPVAASGEGTPVAAASAAATPGAATPAAGAAPADQIQIVADDIFFAPEEVTIPADRDVTLTLRNEGVAAHTFTIDALDIAVPLPPGEETEITINAPAGEYEYYCTEPGHKDIGMVGTLIVTGDGAATPAVAPEEGAAATEATADTAAPAAASAEPVTIVSHDIFFDPKEITIPADTDVTFMLPNEGVTLHDFSIDELGIQINIQPGETQEVVINAPAGTYEYYCSVPGHKAAGMVGTLTVTGDGAATASAPAEEAASEQAAPPAAEAGAASASAEPVTVVSHDIFFDPKELTIPADTDVTLSLPNEGVTLHDFTIDELGIQVAIQPGETQEVVINAPAGTYEYYCSVPGHKAAGMVGTLTVTAAAAASAPQEATPAAAAAAPEAATPAPAAAETAPAATEAAGSAAATEPVTVVSHDIFFEPTEISIPADTDVTVSLPNEGVTLHDFTIDELGIAVKIQPGETEEVVINAPAGTYEYYCSVPGHKAAGMVGTLTVVAGDAAAAPVEGADKAQAAAPDEATPAPAATAAAAAPASEGAAGAAASSEPVTIVSHDIFFDPKELTIPADTDVTFSLPNEGVTQHDFSIDELGIQVAIQPGETQEVVINAPAGTYEYYCSVPGHKAAGMVGTLTVG